MRPPEFWSAPPDRPTVAARALSPLSALVVVAGRLRRVRARPARVPALVVCVGNLSVGGTGKTPTALALCARLDALGARPHILSRGYGGALSRSGPHRVDLTSHRAADVGDEPLLMARRRPVWIGADRVASARAAIAAGADALVLDDGHQNPSLVKDLSLVVIDVGAGHGNGRVLPAGPLREPLEDGFARADAAVLVGDGDAAGLTPPELATFRASVRATEAAPDVAGRRLFAFAGIGRPEKFYETLRSAGAVLVETRSFPDHHAFTEAEVSTLAADAARLGAELITTEKDAMRLDGGSRAPLVYPIALALTPGDAFDALLSEALSRSRAQSST